VLRGVVTDRAVEVEGNQLPMATLDGYRKGQDAAVGIRAENIEVHPHQTADALGATVRVIEPLGSHLLLTLSLGAQTLKANVRTDFPVQAESKVWLRLDPDTIRMLGAVEIQD